MKKPREIGDPTRSGVLQRGVSDGSGFRSSGGFGSRGFRSFSSFGLRLGRNVAGRTALDAAVDDLAFGDDLTFGVDHVATDGRTTAAAAIDDRSRTAAGLGSNRTAAGLRSRLAAGLGGRFAAGLGSGLAARLDVNRSAAARLTVAVMTEQPAATTAPLMQSAAAATVVMSTEQTAAAAAVVMPAEQAAAAAVTRGRSAFGGRHGDRHQHCQAGNTTDYRTIHQIPLEVTGFHLRPL